MNISKFDPEKRIRSFNYAGRGIKFFVSREQNAWIHIAVAIVTILAGFFFDINRMEWIAVIFCIGLVLSAEGFNTAIEYLCNVVSPEWDEAIGRVKDVAAGSVLICAVVAGIIGLIIFVPYIFALF